MFPWILLSAAFAVALVCLAVKIILMRRTLDEIREQLAQKLDDDTNTLITISSGDKKCRELARDINTQLVKLRRQKHRFVKGDTELKNAVTNISHDLRTPLTAISAYLELLDEEEKSETTERYLAVIKNRTEDLMGLTEELFRYSVILSPEYDTPAEMTDIKAVLEESILGFYAALKERGITPELKLAETRVMRMANPASLSRVFANILSNAIKYSDGDLAVELSSDGQIRFSNHAALLSEVEVEKLFDRFFTLESARKSTGLGLSIAKLLVEQMNGKVHAAYKDGVLSICISLPEGNE